ncbi:MAG: cohesin domain-containing protein [Brevefilum sp.]
MFTKKTLFKTLGLLIAVAVLLALLPGAVLADDPPTGVTVCAEGCNYTDIQDAIDAVGPEDTVIVKAGTYTDGGESGYEVKGRHLYLEDGVIIANSGNCFSINHSHSYIVAETSGSAICHANNYYGIDSEVPKIEDILIDGLEITGKDINGDPVNIQAGIRFSQPSTNNMSVKNVSIVNNYIHDIRYDVDDGNLLHPAIYFSGSVLGNLTIQGNRFVDTGGIAYYSDTADARYNYWGTAGVTEKMVKHNWSLSSAVIDFSPWCTDPDCSGFGYTLEAPFNPDVPPQEEGLYFGEDEAGNPVFIVVGDVTLPGGLQASQEGMLIFITQGSALAGNSPCVHVTADNVTIEGELPGMQSCVPTGDSPGILVDEDVQGLRVKNLYFDATETTSEIGIDFLGGIDGFMLLNNYFDGFDTAIKFDGAITTNFDEYFIQGNMFKGATIDAGSNIGIDARYNSWGVNAASTITGVTTTPFTHADLWVETDFDAFYFDNKVLVGTEITYTVKANLTEITGAEFTLTYPATLLTLGDVTPGTDFGAIPSVPSLIDTATAGEIKFAGTIYDEETGPFYPVTGTDIVLYTVEFTTGAALNTAELALVEILQGFSMTPGVEYYTNHVYPLKLDDAELTIFDLPTITSDDVQGYYLTGEEREFNINMQNPATGLDYALMIFDYRLDGVSKADIESFEFYAPDLDDWIVMGSRGYETYGDCDPGPGICGQFGWAPGGFGPVDTTFNETSKFRVTFKDGVSGTFNFTLELSGKYTYADPDWTLLTTYENELVVYTKPVITSDDIQGPYQAGVEEQFNLEITIDPAMCTNDAIEFALHFDFPDGTKLTYAGTEYVCDATGCTIPVDPCDLKPFTVVFPHAYEGQVTVSLFDTEWPNRLLADETFDFSVYDIAQVTGRVTMQGRMNRGGVEMTLTDASKNYVAISLDQMGTNLTFADVTIGLYEVTTEQDRYLDVPGATLVVAPGTELPFTKPFGRR